MNRSAAFPIILALLLFPFLLRAEDEPPEKIYREAYTQLQDGQKAKYEAEKAKLAAIRSYKRAVFLLEELQARYGEWNPTFVKIRLEECRRRLTEIEEKPAVVKAAPPAPVEKEPLITTAPPAAVRAGAQVFVASRNSKVFHLPSCEWAQKISSKNRVEFPSYEDARRSGRRPCRTCAPQPSGARAAAVSPRPPAVSAPPPVVTAPPPPSAAPPPAEPSKAADGEFWASRKGKSFHRPSCQWAERILPMNLVKYRTREEAIAAGKKPCSSCSP